MYLVCNKTVSDYQLFLVVKRRPIEIFEKHPPVHELRDSTQMVLKTLGFSSLTA